MMGFSAKGLTGERFGRLVVLGFCEPYIKPCGKHEVQYACQCDCGNVTKVLRFKLLSGHTKSCGCLQKEIAAKSILKFCAPGESHHSYDKTITKEERLRRTLARSDSQSSWWKRQVRARDGWKCVLCGSKERVEVHHIIGVKDRPEMALDLDNGVCLCRKHHVGLHVFYGGFRVSVTRDMLFAYSVEVEND